MKAERRITFLPTLITAIILQITLAACQAPAAAPLPTGTSLSPTETPFPLTETPAPQAEGNSLVGTWIQEDSRGEFFLEFYPDGTFAAAHLYNDLEKFPKMKGTYQIDDAVLTITVDPGTFLACADKTGQYTITPDGADQFLLQELDWEQCLEFGLLSITTQPWIAYSPEE